MAGDKTELPTYSKARLGQMFGLHRNTVANRLKKVAPDGTDPHGHPVYTVPTAAQWLVDFRDRIDPAEDEDGEIDPDRLAPEDAKNYWDAQLKKQKFLQEEGDLWPSLQVLDMAAGILKPLTAFHGFADLVEKRADLTVKQATVVQKEADRVLKEVHDELTQYADSIALQQSE